MVQTMTIRKGNKNGFTKLLNETLIDIQQKGGKIIDIKYQYLTNDYTALIIYMA